MSDAISVPRQEQSSKHVDVIIVGAGLSGIGAACHLQQRCPERTFAILEGRAAIGGTWDLFRYPGVRSDSDMHTLGYTFRPWRESQAIVDGGRIRQYIEETAREHDVSRHIRFDRRVVSAKWSSADAVWTVETVSADGNSDRFTGSFLLMGSGYYRYANGYSPEFSGTDSFTGRLVHPQQWPVDLDYSGKTVVVIGSGATAMTLVPAMAKTAKHVVMLQRSPTYVLSRPTQDRIAQHLRKWLPNALVSPLVRFKNISLGWLFFTLSRRRAELVKKLLLGLVRQELGADDDVAKHFTPTYQPWDQRLCVVPDSDLFEAIRNGRATVVTDHIDRFTPTGLALRSGQELAADIIVTATGLQLEVLGGVHFEVDGQSVDMAKVMLYKGAMLSDVPNLAMLVGYTNASWTLKTDLVSAYFCRLLRYMRDHRYNVVVPRRDASVKEDPFLDLTSGYVQRAAKLLPRQGNKAPWKLRQNYFVDFVALKLGRFDDGVLAFSSTGRSSTYRKVPSV